MISNRQLERKQTVSVKKGVNIVDLRCGIESGLSAGEWLNLIEEIKLLYLMLCHPKEQIAHKEEQCKLTSGGSSLQISIAGKKHAVELWKCSSYTYYL